eukprot:1265541-Rhodomonas_salina.5
MPPDSLLRRRELHERTRRAGESGMVLGADGNAADCAAGFGRKEVAGSLTEKRGFGRVRCAGGALRGMGSCMAAVASVRARTLRSRSTASWAACSWP